MKKSTLTTLLGLLFVLPFSSCEAVPSESGSSLETLASSTSESLLDDSFETEGTASSSRAALSEPTPTPQYLKFTLNTEIKGYEVSLNEEYTGLNRVVVIPDEYYGVTVKSIAEKGFSCLQGPSAVYIPKTILRIGDKAFEDCGSSLSSIDVSPDNPKYSSFRGMLFNKDKTKLIRCPKGKLGEIRLPNNVLTLCDHSFYKCNLAGFRGLPNSLVTIGESAFELATKMPSTFYIPDNVTEIGKDAFNGASISELVLGNSLQTIGENAFQNCGGLTHLEIPSSVRTIETCAFDSCRSLESVTINSGLETIEENAFANCTSLIGVTIPDTVSSISTKAFINCSSMEWFNVSPENPYYSSLHDVLYNKDQTVLIRCPENKKRITLPDTITTIGEFAYYSNKKITSFVIPDSVTRICAEAFYECKALKTVTINSKVLTEIDDQAFYGCSSLRSIAIPDSINRVGSFAFDSCTSLSEVSLGSGVTLIDTYAFRKCTSLVTFSYNGTMMQWANVAKREKVFFGSSIREITCTNGRASLNFTDYL